jgi:hypothetical protein
MESSSVIRLSQTHLNLLQTCPPQFQRVYLEQLTTPMSPQQQERMTWGSQFHLLMQQRELGLPIQALVSRQPALKKSLESFLANAPEIANLQAGTRREAEHCRTLMVGEYLLTVIYDLLICYPQEAKIFDWKTYLKPETPEKLAQNWQTRLYLYILAETSDYAPEQLSMTYWFVRNHPQSVTFTYSQPQHQQTQRDLNGLLGRLGHYLTGDFDHIVNCQQTCPYYLSFFNPKLTKSLPTLEEIEEINPFKGLV